MLLRYSESVLANPPETGLVTHRKLYHVWQMRVWAPKVSPGSSPSLQGMVRWYLLPQAPINVCCSPVDTRPLSPHLNSWKVPGSIPSAATLVLLWFPRGRNFTRIAPVYQLQSPGWCPSHLAILLHTASKEHACAHTHTHTHTRTHTLACMHEREHPQTHHYVSSPSSNMFVNRFNILGTWSLITSW